MAEAVTEEVSERCLHGGRLRPIPIHLDLEPAQRGRGAPEQRGPDAPDGPAALDIRQHEALAGSNTGGGRSHAPEPCLSSMTLQSHRIFERVPSGFHRIGCHPIESGCRIARPFSIGLELGRFRK